MIILSLFTGLVFIGIGFLVKHQPDLIAGYYTMPKEKRKNVDIVGLSTFIKNGLIIIGIVIIASSILLKIIHLEGFTPLIMIAVILIGIVIICIKAQKYDHNNKKTKKMDS